MASSLSSPPCMLALSSLSLSSSPSSAPSASVSSVLPKSCFLNPLPKCCHLATGPPKSLNPFMPTTSAVLKPVFLTEDRESPEEIRLGYEALYGPAFSGLKGKKSPSKMGEDEDGPAERGRRGRSEEADGFSRGAGGRDKGMKDSMEEKVVQIRRVTKVVKGGKQLSFRAIVVVGDKKGRVGVGVGKAKEVITAVQKSAADARRHIVNIPLTKYQTFPHKAEGKFGAAKVMLRPAATGTGVNAGGAVRVVLELGGVINALGKELGSKNPLNNARAVIEAVSSMKQFRDVANERGLSMEELWK